MKVPATVATLLRAACLLALPAIGATASARAAASRQTPTVAELTGGVTPGFTPGSDPDGITAGPDGHIWFTEYNGQGATNTTIGSGGVGRVNGDGSATELIGGKTPGFSAQGVTTGADRFRFTGRVRRHGLAPGRYRLQAIPRNGAGSGAPAHRNFEVTHR